MCKDERCWFLLSEQESNLIVSVVMKPYSIYRITNRIFLHIALRRGYLYFAQSCKAADLHLYRKSCLQAVTFSVKLQYCTAPQNDLNDIVRIYHINSI